MYRKEYRAINAIASGANSSYPKRCTQHYEIAYATGLFLTGNRLELQVEQGERNP